MSDHNSVLIADDDEDIRTLVALILSRAGFATTCVDGGSPVVAAVADVPSADQLPNVFVLDVRMPDVSGLDLCRQLKADRATAARPVLLISAESSPDDVSAGYAAGCDDYLPKPFSARELVRRVEALLAADDPGPTFDKQPA